MPKGRVQLHDRCYLSYFLCNFSPISDYYDAESMVHTDTRSFILKKPKLSEEILPQNQQLGKRATEAIRVLSGRLIQTR